jgi:hypothetical protein
MPITITPAPPDNLVGSGVTIQYQSSFIGPLPTGSVWQTSVWTTGTIEHLIVQQNDRALSATHSFVLNVPQAGSTFGGGIGALLEGENVTVRVDLVDNNNNVLDSGASSGARWTNTFGLTEQIGLLRQQGSGGLTPTEAQQLQDTTDSSFLVKAFNFVVEEPLVSFPVPGPINAVLDTPVYGVLIRLATIPPELVPTGPDDEYWVKTLATVRVFRGSDMWIRAPIHTPSKIVSFWGEHLLIGLAAIWVQQWLQQMTLQVFFLPGVTGTATLLHLP